MRCSVYNCRENENGYCSCSSYVQITEKGMCDCMFIKQQLTAEWEVWPGWIGNHDMRIEDATCSNCGYEHPTVRRTYGVKETPQEVLNKLSDTCPKCGAAMVKEKLGDR